MIWLGRVYIRIFHRAAQPPCFDGAIQYVCCEYYVFTRSILNDSLFQAITGEHSTCSRSKIQKARYRVCEEAERQVQGHRPFAIGLDGKRVRTAIKKGTSLTEEQITLIGWDGHRYEPQYYGYAIAADKISKCVKSQKSGQIVLTLFYFSSGKRETYQTGCKRDVPTAKRSGDQPNGP